MVLLSESRHGDVVQRWRSRFPGASVVVVSPAEPPPWDWANVDPRARPGGPVSQVSATIRQLGVLDAIVDLLPREQLPGEVANRTQLFRRLVGYIGMGGVYVVDREAVADPEGTERLVSELARARAAARARTAAPGTLVRSLARAAKLRHVGPDVVIVSKEIRHHVKLRDGEADQVLPAREPDIRLTCLAERPSGTLTSRATVSSYGGHGHALPQTFDYPELHLRHYEGDIVLAGRTLMVSGSTVLPDSFRHHLARRLDHPWLERFDTSTARIKRRVQPSRVLDGDFYQLDSTFTGHFGHVMTEVVSRLWGWDLARERHPDQRAIMFRRRHRPLRPDLELGLLAAFGIEEEQVVWVDEPVALRSVTSATPMWHNADPLYVHPDLADVWQRLTAGLLRVAPDLDTPERIFVSRGASYRDRLCRNLREVEDEFTRHGFTVVYPEEHGLAEQALIFSRATHVAGLGGSAMVNLMHCRRLRAVVILNHDGYTARNEHLFTALTGGQVDYFWSRADKVRAGSGWSRESFKSSWAFDFAEHGARLRALLGSF